MKKYLIPSLFIIPSLALCQQNGAWKEKIFYVKKGSYSIDTLTLITSSTQLYSFRKAAKVDSANYSIYGTTLYWRGSPDSISIRYQTLSFDLGKPHYHLDTTLIQQKIDGTYIGIDYTPFEQSGNSVLDFKGLNYNGSYARGLSIGNSQNLVLNSNFNLQLAGKLADDVEIQGAITDNNLPIQPEGNTRQLREFDKIYIQLKRKNNTLLAGDYELTRPNNSYFQNYYKKLQGGTFTNSTDFLKKGKLDSKVSIAISRGKFARNTLLTQEGNQGPYRLIGAEGETYIIVLAGTEKVWLDGQILQRGQDADYIMDYNRGDITFSSHRLITKDSRVIIEFEYAVQNFLRSLVAVSNAYTIGKWKLNFNVYNEQDSRTGGSLSELSSSQIQSIRDAGDKAADTLITSIDTMNATLKDRITYRLIDTTYNGNLFHRVLVYSPDSIQGKVTATFTDVGSGKGNYIQSIQAVNGRVYAWSPPDSLGRPTGSFEPSIRLFAPSRQMMLSVGAGYTWKNNASLESEFAWSILDKNRLSKIDGGDDQGIAFYTKYKQAFTWNKKWNFDHEYRYEFTHRNFKAINPYRPAEFTRDWNLDRTLSPAAEQLGSAKLGLTYLQNQRITYEFSTLLRENQYRGIRQNSAFSINKYGFKILAQASLLDVKGNLENSSFFRPRVDISKSFKKLANWTLGISYEGEKNKRISTGTDTLERISFAYDLYRATIMSPEKKNWQFSTGYTLRNDFLPKSNNLIASTQSQEINVNGKWNVKSFSQLSVGITQRQLSILDSTITTQQQQKTYLGRIEHNLNLWKNSLFATTGYEIGSGQEQKIEYEYHEVNPGEGNYIWIDRNSNKIKELNEFEIAPTSDQGNYLRFIILTNSFVRTHNVQFTHNFRFDPKSIWIQKKGILHTLSRFSWQSNIIINRRVLAGSTATPWNPFEQNLPDSVLVALNNSQHHTLYFNRADAVFGAEIGYNPTQIRSLLSTGVEGNRQQEYIMRIRWNLNRQYSFQGNFSKGNQASTSEFFTDRNYHILFYKIEPQLNYQFQSKWRFSLQYKLRTGENQTSITGKIVSQEAALESTFSKTGNTTIRGRFSFVRVAFNGDINSPLGFSLLNGLQQGKNYIWSLNIDKSLQKNIQIGINYEGRKNGDLKIVHVGRAVVKAVF